MIPAAFDYVRAGSADEAVVAARRARRRRQAARRRPLAAAADEAAAGDAVGARRRRPRRRPVLRPRRRRPRRHRRADPPPRPRDQRPAQRPRCRSLAHVAGQVGDPQVRHRGTIGGSIAHGDPASDLPGRRARPRRHARGPRARRASARSPADDFFPGFLETALAPDELLTEIRVPKVTGAGWSFQKFNRRAQDWAIVGVAAVQNGDDRRGPREHGLDAAAGRRRSSRRSARARRRRRRRAGGRGHRAARPTSTPRPSTAGTWPRCSCAGPWRKPEAESTGSESGKRRRGQRGPRPRTTTWPTRASPRPSSWRCGCAGRCCSRARPASARPRWPRPLPLDGRRAPPPPVLRGHRRRPGRLRVGLLPPAAPPPRRRGVATRRASLEDELYSERFLVRRPLLRAIDYHGDAAAGAAHRRGRPGRRRVRGLPARDPLRLRGHRPRARHVPRRGAAGGGRSPRTAPATSTTRSSAAASTTGSSHPDFEREVAIVAAAGPGGARAARPPGGGGRRASAALELYKPPGVAETIDWARRSPRSAAPTSTSTRSRRPSARAQVPRGPGAGAGPRAGRHRPHGDRRGA